MMRMKLLAIVCAAALAGCNATAPKGVKFEEGEQEACAKQPADRPCEVWQKDQLEGLWNDAFMKGRIFQNQLQQKQNGRSL